MKKLCLALLACCGIVHASPNVIYQYSTPGSLLRGQYGPVVSVKAAKQKGIDFAIGAGIGLGELIVNNGHFYLADPHGKISELANSAKVSYLTGVHFVPTETDTFINVTSWKMLQSLIESHITSPHSFYAIKITAKQANITARSENIDQEPYTPINIWMQHNQNTFTLQNQAVTLIIFRTPDDLSQLSPLYHAHFISDNHIYGGHIFDISAPTVTVQLEKFDNIHIHLAPNNYPVIKDAKAGTMSDFAGVVESGS